MSDNITLRVALELATGFSLPNGKPLPAGALTQLGEMQDISRELPPEATIGDLARAFLTRRLAYLEMLKGEFPNAA